MNYGAIINTGASQEALNQIKEVYESLDELGYTLRTNSSYKELLESLVNKPEVYLPYDGKDGIYQDDFTKPDPDAYVIGEIVHSNWNGISQVLQDTYAANMHSLGGHDLQDNSDFLITWSSNGRPSGSAGMVERAAKILEIPVFNLGNEDAVAKLIAFIEDIFNV